MSKKKKPFEIKNRKKSDSTDRKSGATSAGDISKIEKPGFFRDRGVRETIESIVVAVMLALLFRAYEAEAFVIPTGSMAPTLMGRHLDTECDKCGYQYRTGASSENPNRSGEIIFETTCPLCRYEQSHDRALKTVFQSNEDSFNGDRILVSKFAYDLAEPERWDVIVFKFPGNAKQNYIKRLVGTSNETLKLINGDVYTKPLDESRDYEIARKPPHKLTRMLQLVDDTQFLADELVAANWPSRWQQWSEADDAQRNWKVDETHKRFTATGSDQPTWLGYRHIVPRTDDWQEIQRGKLPERIENFTGELITDYYTYNDCQPASSPGRRRAPGFQAVKRGAFWVGDLAVEADLDVQGNAGSIGIDLVEGGIHFTCWIDVSTGKATVSASDSRILFGELQAATATATTRIKGPGKRSVRFANVDNQLSLWIDNRLVEFDTPLVYTREAIVAPKWGEADPGDAQPISIGTDGVDLEVTRLKVLRDIYYVARLHRDLESRLYRSRLTPEAAFAFRDVVENPEVWSEADSIDLLKMGAVGEGLEYRLEADQLMPLGDNSPESSDARAWSAHYIERDMLTGKALFVYWPHAWRPFWPNFRRMGFIK